MTTNPYLESVSMDVRQEKADIISTAEQNDERLEDTDYDTVEGLKDHLDDEYDDINKALQNIQVDYYGDKYTNLEFLLKMGELYGEFKGRYLENENSHSLGWMLYERAYMCLYDEIDKLLWTIQNE